MALEQFTANWNYPTNIRQGLGRIKELPDVCKQLGMQAPLLITDPGLAEMTIVTSACKACCDAGLSCEIFSDIVSNPTEENVAKGVEVYGQGDHDGVIAFGGGSAIDAAKAVALMVGQDRPLWDFEDIADNWSRVNVAKMAPVVAVPTTAGTGSEVGRASVITDSKNHIKRLIFHPKMLPEMVILDAELTFGLPAHLTAATGMDAFSHALEAYCADYYHPMAEGIALEAIRLVKDYLPRATENGQDRQARSQLLVASTMGATAFQRGLGAMHALAHPLGALYNSHHGLLNAILMPYVLQANRAAIEVKIARLATYLELPDTTFSGFLRWVVDLREQLGIPHTLADINIDEAKSEQIGQMAFDDPSAAGNPVAFSASEYRQLFENARRGRLSLD
ncbi:MAG TPA: iron-containing alcohol dehydrogenase [Aeromonadales bacterium]|nr:iron-containing alcohol dehydrogenase [Aeromonadales bacterium]